MNQQQFRIRLHILQIVEIGISHLILVFMNMYNHKY